MITEAGIERRFKDAVTQLKKNGMPTFRPLLPVFLSLKGEPYSLDDYFPFETFYRTRMPRRTLLKTARQVSKSTNLAARGIINNICIPFFSTLFISPQYEQIRRFSGNYVGNFLNTSPMREMLMGPDSIDSVLQKTFANKSQMFFSFALLSAERVRGISANKNVYDECQDIDKDFLPIIRETMSGSKYGDIEEFAGTPKSLENTIEMLWQESSQAEWVIPCSHCRYDNVPALAYDLDKMIGPWRADISEDRPGVICAKCNEPLYPRLGRWIHAVPDRRWKSAGYHIPQIIMPMHYGDHEKWAALLAKRAGGSNTQIGTFYNEVCGESYDAGSRLVTITDLRRAACLPWKCDAAEAVKYLDEYTFRVLAVDWGGGGAQEVSFTSMAVLGMRADGSIDVIWGMRSLTPHDHLREAQLCIGILSKFQCHILAHDYTGAGSLRETLIIQAGYPIGRVLPISYIGASTSSRVMTFKPPTKLKPRPHYQVDKTRSLLLTCNQIKQEQLRFFQADFDDKSGLIHDFLALVDQKVDGRAKSDVYLITRVPGMTDDFAQAVNIGSCALWHMTDKWPDMAKVAGLQMSEETLRMIEPPDYSNIHYS